MVEEADVRRRRGRAARKKDNSSSGVHVAIPDGFRKRQTDGNAEGTCHTIL